MRNEKVETGKSFISRHLKSMVLIVLCIAASVSFVFAAVLFSSHVKGNTDFGTGAIVDLENNALVAHSVTVEQAELKFSKAGDQVDFKVRITNNSDANLHYYYGVSVGAETAANGLSGAILVYYDGEFIDTLAHLCQNGEGRIDGDDFVMAKGSAAEESAEHLITFQLHIAAEASVFDKKSVDVKVISYTETADGYWIKINPEGFYTSETKIGIFVTIRRNLRRQIRKRGFYTLPFRPYSSPTTRDFSI